MCLLRRGFIGLVLLAILAGSLSFPTHPAVLIAQSDDAAEITALLDRMEDAVRAQDKDTYLSYADLSDPVFALEHTRWADDWAGRAPVKRFDLMVDHLVIEGSEATADLKMFWSLRDDPTNRRAVLPVLFRRDDHGVWRYAGEQWTSTETEHFIVRAAPGLEEMAGTVTAMLPDVYDWVTTSLDYTPTGDVEIKLYDSREALAAVTLLSLPPITGWNEPGESLKLAAGAASMTEEYLRFVLAHEFTHKLTFDMAGNSHGCYPWWLEEGIADYVAFSAGSGDQGIYYMDLVRGWQAAGELAPWDTISDFENTPLELWDYVYAQGYVFVRYVTEVYGADQRNQWLRVMADLPLDESTQEVFEISFDELNQDFLDWLAEQ
jgi:hypothetical protein